MVVTYEGSTRVTLFYYWFVLGNLSKNKLNIQIFSTCDIYYNLIVIVDGRQW